MSEPAPAVRAKSAVSSKPGVWIRRLAVERRRARSSRIDRHQRCSDGRTSCVPARRLEASRSARAARRGTGCAELAAEASSAGRGPSRRPSRAGSGRAASGSTRPACPSRRRAGRCGRRCRRTARRRRRGSRRRRRRRGRTSAPAPTDLERDAGRRRPRLRRRRGCSGSYGGTPTRARSDAGSRSTSASPAGHQTCAPVASASSATAPMWSTSVCVTRIAPHVSRAARARAAARARRRPGRRRRPSRRAALARTT